MRITQNLVVFSIASAILLAACGENTVAPAPGADPVADTVTDNDPAAALAPEGWTDAAGVFVDRQNDSAGTVLFAASPSGGAVMRVALHGLSEGWHGIHLHQIGDCSDHEEGFKASGGHINPGGRDHGLLNPAGPEAADLPNLYAGPDGRATAEIYNADVALLADETEGGGSAALIDADGFAVIVHQNADDHVTQPIGGAGERVACAAIARP